VCCSVLQCVAVCCSVLQCVAVCCSCLSSEDAGSDVYPVAVCCSVLQCVAVCCSVLQCVAVCCSVLQLFIERGRRIRRLSSEVAVHPARRNKKFISSSEDGPSNKRPSSEDAKISLKYQIPSLFVPQLPSLSLSLFLTFSIPPSLSLFLPPSIALSLFLP